MTHSSRSTPLVGSLSPSVPAMEPQKSQKLAEASACLLPYAAAPEQGIVVSRRSPSTPRLTRTGLLGTAATVFSKATLLEKVSSFTKTGQKNSRRLSLALEHLQGVLQGVDPSARRSTIQNMTPNLRTVLMNFILASRNKAQSFEGTATTTATANSAPKGRRPLKPGAASKRIVTRAATGQHKACMDINALRMYTRWTKDWNAAKRSSEVLAGVRDALVQALEGDPELWKYRPEEAFRVCEAVLRADGTSEMELGLGVIVSLRASKWLGTYQVISPSQPLRQALESQARLLRARKTSWEAFRAEWALLVPAKRHGVVGRLLPAQALAMADSARQRVAEARVSLAVRAAARALARESASLRGLQRRQGCAVRVARSAAMAQMATPALKLKRKREKELEKERRKWSRRRDLTMEEIMRGPPAHLREQ